MGITTKAGDKGKTALYKGGWVSKDDLRVESCGSLDELCSYLGLVKSILKSKKEKEIIESIQKDLFTIGSEIACRAKFLPKLKNKIAKSDIEKLNKAIERLEKRNKSKKRCFCLPGENTVSSFLDIARTVARRTERRITTLLRKKIITNKHILIYLNRASDFLFLLARSQEKNPRKIK